MPIKKRLLDQPMDEKEAMTVFWTEILKTNYPMHLSGKTQKMPRNLQPEFICI